MFIMERTILSQCWLSLGKKFFYVSLALFVYKLSSVFPPVIHFVFHVHFRTGVGNHFSRESQKKSPMLKCVSIYFLFLNLLYCH